MPAFFKMIPQTGASIPNADTGQRNVYIDDITGLWTAKDSGGATTPASPGVATDLEYTGGGSVAIDAGAAPVAIGDALVIDGIGPDTAGWIEPRAGGLANSLLVKAAVQTAGPVSATIDELVLCDPGTGGGSNNIVVQLPPVGVANTNRLIGVKIIATVDGFKVSVEGDPGDAVTVIDGLTNGDANLDLTTDRQWMIVLGTATGWLIIG